MNIAKTLLQNMKTRKRKKSFDVYWNGTHRVEVFSSTQSGANVIDYLRVRFDKTDYCIYMNESDYIWECIPEHGCAVIAKGHELDEVLMGAYDHTKKISDMNKQVMALGRRTTPPKKPETDIRIHDVDGKDIKAEQ